jgi:uncharacterized protein YhfF
MMMTDPQSVLQAAFPGEAARYFAPMSIGRTAQDADTGAALILDGVKTTTSSAHWDYPDGRIPFVGALSVLLDGAGRCRAIVETLRVEIMPFRAIDADFARAYGEGERTLDWFRSVMGAWYRDGALRHGQAFSGDTPIICEWFAVVRRL